MHTLHVQGTLITNGGSPNSHHNHHQNNHHHLHHNSPSHHTTSTDHHGTQHRSSSSNPGDEDAVLYPAGSIIPSSSLNTGQISANQPGDGITDGNGGEVTQSSTNVIIMSDADTVIAGNGTVLSGNDTILSSNGTVISGNGGVISGRSLLDPGDDGSGGHAVTVTSDQVFSVDPYQSGFLLNA
ncbi:hypothetical protein FHG87_025147 [Trinorchestia longiramus]|nr:hypothetical protein FHG87_025147 [Trinorchestia longiramus]